MSQMTHSPIFHLFQDQHDFIGCHQQSDESSFLQESFEAMVLVYPIYLSFKVVLGFLYPNLPCF